MRAGDSPQSGNGLFVCLLCQQLCGWHLYATPMIIPLTYVCEDTQGHAAFPDLLSKPQPSRRNASPEPELILT